MDRIIVFDIWSDFAHFRRFETTTSPLTYPFPTGTAIAGILAAIVGLPRDSYYSLFSRSNVEYSLRILNPIKKIVIPINIIKTDEENWSFLWKLENPRAPTPFEFVKNPKYRIYVRFKASELENFYNKLKQFLEEHRTVYTPYLGISEMIANFEFVGDFPTKFIQVKEPTELHSIARIDSVGLIIEKGKTYARETLPLYMDCERRVVEYCHIVYEVKGQPIKIQRGTICEVGDENVSFL